MKYTSLLPSSIVATVGSFYALRHCLLAFEPLYESRRSSATVEAHPATGCHVQISL